MMHANTIHYALSRYSTEKLIFTVKWNDTINVWLIDDRNYTVKSAFCRTTD